MPYNPHFKMKHLPKAEYDLLKAIRHKYNVEDHEAVTIALRCFAAYYGIQEHGPTLVDREVQIWRANPNEQRTYELL